MILSPEHIAWKWTIGEGTGVLLSVSDQLHGNTNTYRLGRPCDYFSVYVYKQGKGE